MNEQIYSGPAHVEMQGNEVLQFIDLINQTAEYSLIGFKYPQVKIFDYRQKGIDALNQVINTGRSDKFARQFNFPFFVTISKDHKEGNFLIELRDTVEQDPKFMLWIAIGFRGNIPNYDYLFQENFMMDNEGSIAVLSLYKRPRRYKGKSLAIYSAFPR